MIVRGPHQALSPVDFASPQRALQIGEANDLAFRLPDDLIEVYKLGVDLSRCNGNKSGWFSIHTRIVIRRDGTLVAVKADPDYTRRSEVEPTIDALRKL